MRDEPKLVIVAGSARGRSVSLSGVRRLSVGRDSGNTLHVPDPAVSRRHFVISAAESGFELTDLESHNGTFVNGVPVRNRLLAHGDTIRVGGCELVFLGREDEIPALESILFEERGPIDLAATTKMRVFPALLYQDSTPERMGRDLQVQLRIVNAISTVRDLRTLQERLLQIVGEVVPVSASAILMLQDSQDQLTATCVWHREPENALRMVIRREITQRVLAESAPVLSKYPSNMEETESILSVPLVGVQRNIGLIYLSYIGKEPGLEEAHVRLLGSAAGLAVGTLENLLENEELRAENRRLKADLDLEGIVVGESPAMKEVENFISRVADSESIVLIRGESGTGKELVARAIHRNSPRADKPFMAINCAAIPDTLLESELFGHEKGAFTGAIATKKGQLEMAAGGTVLLDEVGEMAPSMQAKLLRVLQEREFQRLGGTKTLKLDARVLAATNRDLEKAMQAGEFRQDLYYRLNIMSIRIPPLRERAEDIPLLAMYFLNKHSERCKRPLKSLSKNVRNLLTRYSWPGNIRELENVIERAVVLGTGEEMVPEDLPEALLELPPADGSSSKYHNQLNDLKRRMIMEAMKQSNGKYTEAAKILGLNANYMHRLIRNLQIKSEFAQK